jgi:carboxymethylenebutenolidase
VAVDRQRRRRSVRTFYQLTVRIGSAGVSTRLPTSSRRVPAMERKTAHDFDQDLLILFDAYVHGGIDRRTFLDRASKYAVGGVTAMMLLEQLSPKFLEAQQVSPTDERISQEYVEYPSPNGYGTMRGYLTKPAGSAGKRPGVLVIHENRGLNPHIEDITRRLAVDGFVAFAPDALFPLGGYPGDEDKAREVFPKLDQAKTREDFVAACGVLKARPECTGKIGAVGFCYGGGMVNFLATRLGRDLSAGVAYYGSSPNLEDVPKITAPLMIQSAENDPRINASWPAFEEALKAAKVTYERHLYPGTQHGFNNDTTPRYDAAAAKLSWDRTLAFFRKHVG